MARRSVTGPAATLLTDFGSASAYPAAMKGAILSACPAAQIVDICHDVPAHDVMAAAFVLVQAAPCFPPETLHVVVVDPGVGTGREILVGRFGGQTYLFPDNGVITLIAERLPLEAMFAVRSRDFLPADASMTFHGRDIFAPVAAHILNGLDIRRLGPRPETYKLLDLPVPQERPDGIAGQVVYVDAFGNLITNVPEEMVRARWRDLGGVRGRCAGREVGPLRETYGRADAGETLLLFNSMGMVEIAVNLGRACDALDAGVGAEVRLQGR